MPKLEVVKAGKLREVKLVQPLNAYLKPNGPIEDTLLKLIVVKPVHAQNAELKVSPPTVTRLLKSTEVKLVQLWKVDCRP